MMTSDQSSTFDALMEAAVDAIIIISREGIIERFNRAAEELFGYSEDEVVGKNVKMLMPEPHRSRHDGYLSNYRETGKAAVVGRGREETAIKRSGETFPMMLSVGEIRQEGRRSFVGFVRDMTEFRATEERVRRLEDRLVHADRLVTLGELTAGIAHEINQPLTAIAAYADAGRSMIDRQSDTRRDDMHSICERIGEQSRRAAEVVQRLRKMVRSGRVSKSRHKVNEIIINVLLLFEYEIKKSRIDLDFRPLEPDLEIYVDEIQVQQVLVNLVKNALDVLIESGTENGKVSISVRQRQSELEISVEDNGPGIASEDRAKLFEAFFTTKEQGVGLGLSICRSIATAHGGNLRFSEAEKGGSRFTLRLPLELIG